MLKVKSRLEGVVRVKNSVQTRHPNIRLDKSERISRFEESFFRNFLQMLTQEDFIAYPETDLLIKKLCCYHRVSEKNVFISPGTDAAIKAFFEIAVNPGDEVIITKPCFPMYAVYVQLFGARPIEISYQPNLVFEYKRMLDSITDRTALILLANPNSPIGNFVEIDLIEELVARASRFDIPVLIDEAYYEFSSGTAMLLTMRYENLGVSRTFSKALGAAGIRIGYVIGHEKLIEKLSKWRLMYEVNQVGIKFATYIIDHIDEVLENSRQTKKERELLVKMLREMGYNVLTSDANWIHLHGGKNNCKVVEILKKHKVLFKSDTKIPYDDKNDWVRITIGPGLSSAPYMQEILALGDIIK